MIRPTVYFNSKRQFLLSFVRYIEKPLNQAFRSLITRLENLQTDSIPSDLFNSFNSYRDIFHSNSNFDRNGNYAINILWDIIYLDNDILNIRWNLGSVKSYLRSTQILKVQAEFAFIEYLKFQEINILGPCGPFKTDWISEQVWDLAYQIHLERAWKDLPILADFCQEFGCTDYSILNYLVNSKYHSHLRIHCWVLELILTTEPSNITQLYTFINQVRI